MQPLMIDVDRVQFCQFETLRCAVNTLASLQGQPRMRDALSSAQLVVRALSMYRYKKSFIDTNMAINKRNYESRCDRLAVPRGCDRLRVSLAANCLCELVVIV